MVAKLEVHAVPEDPTELPIFNSGEEAHRHLNKMLEEAVNEDIKSFDTFFQGLGNDPLVRSEVAIIKTWLWWHLRAVEKSEPSL
jgi:hypothetical protein